MLQIYIFIGILTQARALVMEFKGEGVCHFPFLYQNQLQYRCVGDGSGSGEYSWCYSTFRDPGDVRRPCQSPTCKWTTLGAEYVGNIHETNTGVYCSHWNDPNRNYWPSYSNPTNFADDTLGDAANNCRVPDRYSGPWCITASGWGDCDIPTCASSLWCDTKLTDHTSPISAYTASTGTAHDIRHGAVGMWCADPTDTAPWVQVTFTELKVVSAMVIQGSGTGFVSFLKIQFSQDSGSTWLRYKTPTQEFPGNVDTLSEAAVHFPQPLVVTNLELGPTTWTGQPCLKLLIAGCVGTLGTSCSSAPCQQGGTCVESEETYFCLCPEGWNGQSCEEEILTPTQRMRMPTKGGGYCHFPFLYDGVWYHRCIGLTGASDEFSWCYATAIDPTDTRKICQSKECIWTTQGPEYVGSINLDTNGNACLDWDASGYTNPLVFADNSVAEAGNGCRNPDRDSRPWCVVSGSWGYCDIPTCGVEMWCDYNITGPASGVLYTASTGTAANLAWGDGVSWCADPSDTTPNVMIDFNGAYYIVANLAVQTAVDFMDTFKLRFTQDGTTWYWYRQANDDMVFTGGAQAGIEFHPPIVAMAVEVVPVTWSGSTVCAEAIFAGCLDMLGDDCAGHGCQNGGTCIDGDNDYWCYCTAAYTGAMCETVLDTCTSTPCQNGGECTVSGATYTCACLSMYTGGDCENGHARSCVDILVNGLGTNMETRSGMYAINLYNDLVPAGVSMMLVFSGSIPGAADSVTAGVTEQECVDACVAAQACVAVRHDDSLSECHVYEDLSSRHVSHTPLTPDHPIYFKELAQVVDIHCDFTDVEHPITTLPPATQGAQTINDVETPREYDTAIAYWPFTSDQLREILNDSVRCEQKMTLNCLGSRDDYWAIVNLEGNSTAIWNLNYQGTCECLLEDVCTNSGPTCACRANAAPWRQDSGKIYEKQQLPVWHVLGGDTGAAAEQADFEVEALVCTQTIHIVNECTSSPCQHGGTCNDLHMHYTCDCTPGYTGRDCETDFDECASSPCQHGGTCIDQLNRFICTCNAGYVGSACETDVNECASSPCANTASCVDEPNQWRCLCEAGYFGERCVTEIVECASGPCEHGGTCTDGIAMYTCDCSATGYIGNNCQTEIDECLSSPCLYGGTCVDLLASYGCTCAAGFTGPNCETDIDECSSAPCGGGGTCTDDVNSYTCACAAGLTGTNCDIDVDECLSSPCMHAGGCVDQVNGYTCDCALGYMGTHCETELQECQSNPCQHAANCVEGTGGYACQCQPGFIGVHCETNVNECLSSPCVNQGTCQDADNGYVCICKLGFAGPNCHYMSIDGGWASWQEWGTCSTPCGRGLRVRVRDCTLPAPQYGGAYCPGDGGLAEECEADDCTNVDGRWSAWSEWGRCGATCGSGVKTRYRTCTNPAPRGTGATCAGADSGTTGCIVHRCGDRLDGGWSLWGSWSTCSASCNEGTRYRVRTCSQPPAAFGGDDCPGLPAIYTSCFGPTCQVREECAAWSGWSNCSVPCGPGHQSRWQHCPLGAGDDTNGTALASGEVFWQHRRCHLLPCNNAFECYHCSGPLSLGADHRLCRGPTKPCPGDDNLCIQTISPTDGGGLTISKGCATKAMCDADLSDKCRQMADQATTAVGSNLEFLPERFMETHPDTVIQMASSLDTDCHICCTEHRCNRGSLPFAASIYSPGSAARPGRPPPAALAAATLIMAALLTV